MNTIEKLGDEETFRNMVERTITEFEDNGIEVVKDHVFSSCKSLTSVSLPLATSIEDYAFSNCQSLTNVSFPLAMSIKNDAFFNCLALTSASFPIATSIGDSALMQCRNLTSIELPSATGIGSSAFLGCYALTNVSLPAATSIGDSAFYGCSALTSVSLPSVTSIGRSAFLSCNSLETMYIGTESNTVCTLSNAIPSSIGAIYVPYNLVEKYKTATNWSSFASKIQAYETPVSCQSLTITAEDVPGYRTSTTVHYEAVCTYSAGGMMQTGTKVFKGDGVSDTFGINPSGESSRQVEVSYTFLGQTATTTITQDKYLGNPVGGKIYYIDDTADGTYSFYDAEGNPMSNVSVGSTPSYYKVLTAGSKDKYYVYHDELYTSLCWSKSETITGATGTAIGTGKSNTAILLATAEVLDKNTIWYKLQQIRNAYTDGCNDWFVPSKDEGEALRLAIGCTTSTSGAVVVDAGAVTGGTIAGTADGKTHYKDKDGTYYCYPSNTKFISFNICSSSEYDSRFAWIWIYKYQDWRNDAYKTNKKNSVFFVRAF